MANIKKTGWVYLFDGFIELRASPYHDIYIRRLIVARWMKDLRNLKPHNNFYIIISPEIKDK